MAKTHAQLRSTHASRTLQHKLRCRRPWSLHGAVNPM
jgi:hypothetical protein